MQASPSTIAVARRPRRTPFLVSLALALAGCGHSEGASAPRGTLGTQGSADAPASSGAKTKRAPVQEGFDRSDHMQATFWTALVARDEVIAGNLEAARAAARSLAEHDYASTLPADWRHWVVQMQERARDVALAADLRSAAQAVGALGLSCGTCHAQMRTGPTPAAGEPLEWKDPPEDLDQRMLRHAIGADLLWSGLTQDSERAWLDGTVTLTRAPLRPASRDGEPIGPATQARMEQVRTLAERARAARSHPERAAIYGELIAGCADCHFAANTD
jgi:cytochrome c5